MPKLFGLDGSTVRQILKLHALDGATPRRVKKLFGLDGSTVRLIFEDFSSFVAAGTANLIQSPVNEIVDFGVRDDFNAGAATVNVSTSGTGDASNVGGVSGLSIDVDSSHTYSGTATKQVTFNGGSFRPTGKIYPGVPNTATDGTAITGVYAGGTFISAGSTLTGAQTATILGNPQASNTSALNLVSAYWQQRGTSNPNPSGTQTIGSNWNYRGTAYGFTFRWLAFNYYYGQVSGRPTYSRGYYEGSTSDAYMSRRREVYNASTDGDTGDVTITGLNSNFILTNIENVYELNSISAIKVNNVSCGVTLTGRRARVVNGSTKTFSISSGGLTAGGNFTTGNLTAGASTGFITANSTSEAWTLAGSISQTPAQYAISNADNSISVSGTFTASSNATSARDQIQAALNGNSTFVSKFNTGTDINKTVSGVGHKVVRFTSDAAENTSDFSMTITQNSGSNTTPHEETVTQGAVESLQTQVQVTRAVEGTQVSSTKSISSQANTDTAGAEVATLGGDISYDSGTNKLKVQDQDATVTVTNAGSLSFTKE